jgi:drug/metabolite transporter (DMT)-like permease
MTTSARPTTAIACMLAAMSVMPVVDSISKHLAATYSPEQITWMRNLVHALVILPVAVAVNGVDGLQAQARLLQLVRAAAFVLMTTAYITALRTMPLAEALAIVFVFPFLVTILSAIFLGERVGAFRWTAVVIGFAGVGLVIRPGMNVMNAGAPWALAAAVCTAVYVVLTRKLSAHTGNLTLLFWPAALGTLMLSPFVPANWVTPYGTDLGLLVLIGVLAAAGHMLIILAFRFGEASLVAPFNYTQFIMASILGYLLFADFPDLFTLFGIALIIAAGVVVAVREQRLRSRR